MHIIQALLGHAFPDAVMIHAKLYPSRFVEEHRKTVRGLYNTHYGEDGLKNPTTEEWLLLPRAATYVTWEHIFALCLQGEHCPRGLGCESR